MAKATKTKPRAPAPETPNPQPPPLRLMTKAEVCQRVGVTYVTIWRWQQAGTFPRARRINSPAASTAKVAWYAHEIEAWLANLPLARIKGDGKR
jgi:predicted DNA-binding transcriptional regulator AlpA